MGQQAQGNSCRDGTSSRKQSLRKKDETIPRDWRGGVSCIPRVPGYQDEVRGSRD